MTVLVLSFAVLAAPPLALGVAPARAAKTWGVSMWGDDMSQDYEFTPATLTISVGDTVNWTSMEGTHTTTSLPNQAEWWDSGPITLGKWYTFTFTIAGTYNYTSLIDPQMYGTIIVQQPAPEFPGSMVVSAMAIAGLLGLLIERKLRD